VRVVFTALARFLDVIHRLPVTEAPPRYVRMETSGPAGPTAAGPPPDAPLPELRAGSRPGRQLDQENKELVVRVKGRHADVELVKWGHGAPGEARPGGGREATAGPGV